MSARIMIVDDEPGIVDVVQRYFALSGYEVIAARSGEEALKKISCRPDLILLDINMPGLNGLEVCARIRAHVSCPILFLTARIERSDKIVGFQAGGDDYIVKPRRGAAGPGGGPPAPGAAKNHIGYGTIFRGAGSGLYRAHRVHPRRSCETVQAGV